MTDSEILRLRERIHSLEQELRERDQEVAFLKNELSEVNFRLERLVEQSKYELKLIHKIQNALVPTEYPNISGFEFSTKFVASAIKGGDYFDLFDIPEKMKFGIMMSCSSGYAMSALLMSVLMKYSGYRLTGKSDKAAEIVREIQSELAGQLDDSHEASFFFSLVNRRTYQMDFCALGSVSVFYFDYSSGEIELLKNNPFPLTKKKIDNLECQLISLNPRDRLIICSHGLFEATDLDGKRFTPKELLPALKAVARSPVHDLRNEVLYQVEKFTSGAEVRRDRTVVVMEVKDRVIKLAKG